MININDKVLNVLRGVFWVLIVSLTVFYFISAVYGGWIGFSDAPVGDMWDDMVGFGSIPRLRGLGAWFGFHNEHRILITRVLFYFYEKFAGGAGAGLVVVNYSLVIVYAVLLSIFVWGCVYKKKGFWTNFLSVFLLFTSVLLVWGQYENLTWGYQSQFYFVYIFPLVSLLLIQRSVEGSGLESELVFCTGYFFGIAAVFSMANGLIYLPLLCLYLVCMRLSTARVLLVTAVSCFFAVVYFYGYKTPAMHKEFVFSEDALAAVRYFFLYVGAPIYYVFQSKILAKIAGVLLISFFVLIFILDFIKLRSSRGGIVYSVYLSYVILSGVMVACGRSWLGDDSALSSRYMTPVLVLWVLILFRIQEFFDLEERAEDLSKALVLFFLVLWAPRQLSVFSLDLDSIFRREKAVLALAMGVKDPILNALYPYPGVVDGLAEQARVYRSGVFSQNKYAYPDSGGVFCGGNFIFYEVSPSEDSRFLNFKGSFKWRGRGAALKYVNLVENGSVVGKALSNRVKFSATPKGGTEVEGFLSASAKVGSIEGYSEDCVQQLGKR